VAPGALDHIKITGTPTVTLLELAVKTTLKFPLPDKETVDIVPAALTFSVAAADPAKLGLNTTLPMQLAPTATDVPQVVVCENGWGLAVESAMFVIGSATVPLLVTVNDIGALATLIIWLPNAKEVGETV
jgi:hypothetical protein